MCWALSCDTFLKTIAFYPYKLYEGGILVSVYIISSLNLRDTDRLAEGHTILRQYCLPWERASFVTSGGSEYALFSHNDRRMNEMTPSVVHQAFVF